MNETAKQNMGNLNRNSKADSITTVAADTIRDQFEGVRARVGDVTDRAKYYADEVTHVVESHPVYAVLGATAFGFILGALLTRK